MIKPLSSSETPITNSPSSDRISPNPLSSPLSWRAFPVSLPSSPGVYWFLDAKNNVIYVGKAKHLSNRLHSYASSHVSPKVKQLVAAVTQVRYQILDSELEALLTEAELIRLHQPHFNSLLKDDKSPLYIITTKEKYPRVLTVRKNEVSSGVYRCRRSFGPLPSGTKVREVIRIARRLFPYCTQHASKASVSKSCFYAHLGLCPGACTGKISTNEYLQNIHHLELFLSGKYKSIIKDMKKDITRAAVELRFETANILKTKIIAIESVIYRYKSKTEDQPLPQLTESHTGFANLELLRLLKNQGIPLLKLDRIEAYDVANLMGKSPAVSMVVSLNGELTSNQYRHFAIQTLSTPNDIGMLKEAITRRQNHPEWGIPDLILVDGGKGQVKAIKNIISWQIPVIGIAKNPDRLIIPLKHGKDNYRALPLNPSLPGHQLIIVLRDEAHRFARKLFHLHHQQRLLDT
jgi:excinuclease ABC subunit C